jgi:hypothetical protein
MSNGHADKPFMLAEYGTRESDSDPLAKGRSFRDALSRLKRGAFPNRGTPRGHSGRGE